MGALSNAYYKKLEMEHTLWEEQDKVDSGRSLSSKINKSLINKFGILGPIGMIALGLGGQMGASALAANGLIDESTANLLGAAALTPMMLNKIAKMGKTIEESRNLAYKYEKENFRNYHAGSAASQALKSLYGIGTLATAGVGAAGAALGGMGYGAAKLYNTYVAPNNPFLDQVNTNDVFKDIAGYGAHLMHKVNPLSMVSHGFSAAGNLVGSGIQSLGTTPDSFLAQHGHSLGSIGTLIGGMYLMMKALKPAEKIKSKKIQIPQAKSISGLDLISRSTYKQFASQILLLSNQSILTPGEMLLASLLNEINLNTYANVEHLQHVTGKSSEKEIQHALYANKLNDMFEEEEGVKFTKGFTKERYNRRKLTFGILNDFQLSLTNKMYKINPLLARLLTGKSYETFAEELAEHHNNQLKVDTYNKMAGKLGIHVSLLKSIYTSADKFLRANTFEDRQLGLLANIHEMIRFQAQKGLANHQGISHLSKKLNEDEYDYKIDFYERNFGVFGAPLRAIFRPISDEWHRLMGGDAEDNKKIEFSLEDTIKRYLGIQDTKKIGIAFKNKYKEITKTFNKREAMEAYLGKFLPDDMQVIKHELKQQTQFLADLLGCQGCKANVIAKSAVKWRGGFGKFMTDQEFDVKARHKAYSETKKIFDLQTRKYLTKGLDGLPLGILKLFNKNILSDEFINQDILALKNLRSNYRGFSTVPTLSNDENNLIISNENENEEQDESRVFGKLKNINKISKDLSRISKYIKNFGAVQGWNLNKSNFVLSPFQKKNLKYLELINKRLRCFLDFNGIKCTSSGKSLNPIGVCGCGGYESTNKKSSSSGFNFKIPGLKTLIKNLKKFGGVLMTAAGLIGGYLWKKSKEAGSKIKKKVKDHVEKRRQAKREKIRKENERHSKIERAKSSSTHETHHENIEKKKIENIEKKITKPRRNYTLTQKMKRFWRLVKLKLARKYGKKEAVKLVAKLVAPLATIEFTGPVAVLWTIFNIVSDLDLAIDIAKALHSAWDEIQAEEKQNELMSQLQLSKDERSKIVKHLKDSGFTDKEINEFLEKHKNNPNFIKHLRRYEDNAAGLNFMMMHDGRAPKSYYRYLSNDYSVKKVKKENEIKHQKEKEKELAKLQAEASVQNTELLKAMIEILSKKFDQLSQIVMNNSAQTNELLSRLVALEVNNQKVKSI